MSKSRGRAVVTVVLLAALIMGMMPVTPASAWKMKTHAYSANLILDEIAASNGMLEIKPYGKFPVKAEYLAAIRAYPQAYRAGTLGPDGYPDMYIGQAFIHPGPTFIPTSMGARIEGTYTDEWLQQQWDFVQNLPAAHPDKQQALAFLLGWLTHSAGDVFGHDYINQLSGGVFPAISEAAQDPAKMQIIARHNITEAYIDGMIPEPYAGNTPTTYERYMKLDAPTRYIYNYLLKDGRYISGGEKPWAVESENPLFARFRSSDPEPLQWLRETRVEVSKECDDHSWLNVLEHEYAHAWRADIDWAAERWVERNATVAQKLLMGDFETAKTELIHWAWHDGASAAGAPDAVLDSAAVLGNVFGFVAGWVADLLAPALRERITQWVQNNIYSELTERAFNMTWAEMESMKEPVPYLDNRYLFHSVPLFPGGMRAKMDADMGNYGRVLSSSNDSTFVPFYNTMVMAKLILIGPEGDNALLAAAGSPTRITNQNIMLGWVQSLDGSRSWEDGRRQVYSRGWPTPLIATGPTVHSPIYDDRNVWCSLFKGYGPGVLNSSFDAKNADGVSLWKNDGTPMEWRTWSDSASGGVDRVPSVNRAGTSAATDVFRITNTSRNAAAGLGAWTPFVAQAGKTYEMSAWAGGGPDTTRVWMELVFRDAGGNVLSVARKTGAELGIGGDALQKINISATAPAGTVVGWVAMCADGGSADVAVTADDVVVTGAGLSAPTVKPKAYVSKPIARSTMSRTKYYPVYGWLKPRHTRGTYPVRIYKYKKTASGSWKRYGYVKAKASNYSSYTKYAKSIRLPYKGRWRLRAYAPADSKHAAAWSSRYDYVTVK